MAGAGQDSNHDSSQSIVLEHAGHGRFRVGQVVVAVVFVVLTLATVGFADKRTVLAVLLAVLAIAAAVPGGNLSAAASTALGGVIILFGVAQLALLETSLNFFDASVLNVVCVLLFGVLVLSCGLYEWETDEHGRILRHLRRSISQDVRDADLSHG